MALAEPAELLLIKDQHNRALACLTRGLAADEAGRRPEALELYRRGREHLTQGLEVPTGGDRHNGAPWDTARQLQLKMRLTLRNISTRLDDLETAESMTTEGPSELALDLPKQNLYPTLGPNVQPTSNPLLRLYPTVPVTSTQTPHPPTPSPSAGASGTTGPSLPIFPVPALGAPGEQPPAYTPQPTDGHHSLAYSPVAGRLGGQPRGFAAETATGDGDELLFLPRGVQMFFVSAEGQVSSPSHPGYLRIITFGGGSNDASGKAPSTFLHVCDWLYPVTLETPVLLANSGIFMFPDTMAGPQGSYVGIVLSSEMPEADRDMFQDILAQLTDLRIQALEEGSSSEVMNLSEKVPIGPPGDRSGVPMATGGAMGEEEKPPVPEWSEKMSQSILAGTSWLSKGFLKGAEATGKAIHKGASKLREHITPENTPAEVNPRVTRGLHVAKQATGGAVRVSQFLVNGVCVVAGCVGDKLAPHVKKHGAKLIPESMKKTQDGRSNLDGAMIVAASSMQGLSAIWTGLETGAKTVGKSVRSETVTTVKYKYGEETGQATDTAVQSVVNVGVTAFNMDNLVIKGVLKGTGKTTAKAAVKDHNPTTGEPAEKREKEYGEKANKSDTRSFHGIPEEQTFNVG
ncbi:spartin a isoform X2 [Hypomesus transpacificus]|uniref:spartin a isoform X2 n=1 Tax=Hypomesus transpacificus TaxID=137520 RepID=UPI001F082B8C|nr:spartin a isoform X2 [Hypomesus transpacificus]